MLMSAFFPKPKYFFAKIAPLLKAIVLDLCHRFFSSVLVFVRQKVSVNENVSFIDHVSRTPFEIAAN